MTRKEIEAAERKLVEQYHDYETNTNFREPTHEERLAYEELQCREMINSILIYGSSADKGSYSYERYLKPYIKGDHWHKYLLTEQRVDELIAEQKDSLSRAVIRANVYEDSEGCTYNSCHWEDD
jgi:hypothetical protein